MIQLIEIYLKIYDNIGYEKAYRDLQTIKNANISYSQIMLILKENIICKNIV